MKASETISRAGLVVILFFMLVLFLDGLGMAFTPGVVAVDDANEESLANLWGDDSIVADTIDRASDTLLVAGLLFVATLAVHSQFRTDEETGGH